MIVFPISVYASDMCVMESFSPLSPKNHGAKNNIYHSDCNLHVALFLSSFQ